MKDCQDNYCLTELNLEVYQQPVELAAAVKYNSNKFLWPMPDNKFIGFHTNCRL